MTLALQMGDWATWVVAGATAVLAVGTLGTFGVSLVLLRRAAEDKRLEQARYVFAWEEEVQEMEDGWAISYLVRNDSHGPVYDVILNAMCGVRGTFVRGLGVFAPGERRRVRILLPGFPRGD